MRLIIWKIVLIAAVVLSLETNGASDQKFKLNLTPPKPLSAKQRESYRIQYRIRELNEELNLIRGEYAQLQKDQKTKANGRLMVRAQVLQKRFVIVEGEIRKIDPQYDQTKQRL